MEELLTMVTFNKEYEIKGVGPEKIGFIPSLFIKFNFIFIVILLYWGHIVTFIKVLTMYLS
jgi:hypothetical protein